MLGTHPRGIIPILIECRGHRYMLKTYLLVKIEYLKCFKKHLKQYSKPSRLLVGRVTTLSLLLPLFTRSSFVPKHHSYTIFYSYIGTSIRHIRKTQAYLQSTIVTSYTITIGNATTHSTTNVMFRQSNNDRRIVLRFTQLGSIG